MPYSFISVEHIYELSSPIKTSIYLTLKTSQVYPDPPLQADY